MRLQLVGVEEQAVVEQRRQLGEQLLVELHVQLLGGRQLLLRLQIVNRSVINRSM